MVSARCCSSAADAEVVAAVEVAAQNLNRQLV